MVSRRKQWTERARFLATQARDPAPHYQHSEIGYNYRISEMTAAMGAEQMKKLPDIILCDYSMPQFSGLRAAQLLQESGVEIPFILISGTVGEDVAVEAMKHGATDFLLKDRIGRLGPAVRRSFSARISALRRLLLRCWDLTAAAFPSC